MVSSPVPILPEPLELDHAEGGALPAFVLGWDALPPERAAPSFVGVHHQYGGYACSQTILSGLVLPLHANLDRARTDAVPLLEAFRSVAESQQGRAAVFAHRQLELVRDGAGTHGASMSRRDLERWGALLATYYELPRPIAGVEAMLTFGDTPDLSLEGWRALALNGEDAELFVVDRDTLDRLHAQPPSDRASRGPRLHLIWESSD